VEIRKPIWTSSSFLLYAGGFIVLVSALGALAYLGSQYGKGVLVAWTLLPLLVLYACANMFRRRGRWIAAGVFAFATVAVWGVFWGVMFDWWGWQPNNDTGNAFAGFNWQIWLIALLVVIAARLALQRFRFPLLILFVIEAVYYVITDLVSNGGNWSAVVTLLFGFAFLIVGLSRDRGPRSPLGFWFHFAAAAQISGALLQRWHSSDADFALIATVSVIYIWIAAATQRSIWAVYGLLGIVGAATFWIVQWTATPFFNQFGTPRFWVPPLAFGIVGFFVVALGLLAGRRESI